MIIKVPSPELWPSRIKSWAAGLLGNEVLMLRGSMGAGKTSFVSALMQVLGGNDLKGIVSSPTYSLHHEYRIGSSGGIVDHWDLFRIKSTDELDSSGFWETLETRKGLFVVEWPERVPDRDWPKHIDKIDLEFQILPSGRRLVIKSLPHKKLQLC